MTSIDYTGHSDSCFKDALNKALQQAGNPHHYEIVETRGSIFDESNSHYQITIAAFD
jgi:flavin-binding protein dodecin